MKPSKLLRDVLKRIRSAAGTFEDNRQGPNLRYTLADAVLSAFACFFLQSPSFLAFQRRMQDDVGRSNCQTLFGMQGIPSDGQIRNLLDRLVPDSFQLLFRHLLDTLRSKGDFSPFVRLRDRILVALDGLEFHSSRTIHCQQCSSRHTGKDKRPSFFHTMVAAVVVAPGHNRVVPLMPEFVRTQDDPGDQHSVRRRKQDCEINAAKRWLTKWGARMARYRPVYLGDALYATHPFCQQVLHAGADFLFGGQTQVASHAIQVFTRALYPEHRLDSGAEQEDTSLRRALLSLDDRSADSEHGRCRTRHMGGKDRAGTPKAGHLQVDLLHDAFHQPDGNEAQCTGGCSLWAGALENRERVLQPPRTTRTELQTQLRAWQKWAGKPVSHPQPVGICPAYDARPSKRVVEAMPSILPGAPRFL